MKIVATTRSILLRGRSCSKPGTHKFCLCRISSGARCRSAEALGALMSFPDAHPKSRAIESAKYRNQRIYIPAPQDQTIFMAQENTSPEPTGGWRQYRLAIWVLMFYPILILGAALVMIPLLPHFHRSQSHQEEVISPTSHEPFHFSPSVLPPLKAPANRS